MRLTHLVIYVFSSSIWLNQRLQGRLPTEFIKFEMEITEAMLDSIEAVKGKRNPGLWEHRCATHFALK